MSVSKHFAQEVITEVEFVDVEELPTVVQKVTDHPMEDMASVFDSTFTELIPLLQVEGIQPVGAAFSLHHRMPTDTATFEVGFPVDKPLDQAVTTDSGIVLEPSTLPAGKIARISHVGPYDDLGQAWGAFMEAVAAAGKQPELPFWEIYVTEPAPDMDPSTLRTDLVTTIKG